MAEQTAITVGTICEYPRLEHRPWVLVTGLPGTIEEYTEDGWEPEDAGWEDYDAGTELLEFAIAEHIPDDVFALLEGADLAGHREVARYARDDDDIQKYVGPRPVFEPLGPVEDARVQEAEVHVLEVQNRQVGPTAKYVLDGQPGIRYLVLDGSAAGECPDCGATLFERRNWLTDDEYTTEIDCSVCEFSIETQSNLVGRDRGLGK